VEPSAEMVLDWRKADWAALRARLGRPGLLVELERRKAATVWEHLRDEINSAVNHSVPKRMRRPGNKPRWMTRDILKALRRKRRV